MDGMPDGLQQLTHLQRWRGRKSIPGVSSMSDEWNRIGAQVKRDHRRVGRVVEAWEMCVPAALREDARVDGYSRGTLTVAVASSSARYAIDRVLRSGAEARLRQLLGTAFQRVRLVAAPMDQGDAGAPNAAMEDRGAVDGAAEALGGDSDES